MKTILLLAAIPFCFSNLINAQAGRLDSLFGDKGVVKTNLGKNYVFPGSTATRVLMQPDGSMYVLQSSLTKRRANGLLDSSFGLNGFSADAGFVAIEAAIQPDGKIVVTGSANKQIDYGNDIDRSDFAIARYNTDGSLDSSFSGDGKQITDFGEPDAKQSFDEGYAVAIQNNGKIVVTGASNYHIALARYNTDGSLDNTFDGDGKLVNFWAQPYASPKPSTLIQPDGKIIITAISTDDDNFYSLIRFNANGSLDKTFSGDGILPSGFAIKSIALQNDGKIVAGGDSAGFAFRLARYNTDGKPDKSFSGDGKQTTKIGFAAEIKAIALQNDGKIVAAGYGGSSVTPYGLAFAIARYNKDGSLDKSFSGDGKQITDFPPVYYEGWYHTYAIAASAAISAGGKIVAAGSSDYSYVALAKYNTNGSPDSTFGQNGKLIGGIQAKNTVFSSIAVQKDGKTVSVGRTSNGNNLDFAIARYNTDGTPDKTFNGSGANITDFTSKDDIANSVAIQADGKIVVAGGSGIEGYDGLYNSNISIARYNTDGSLDKTFGDGGKMSQTFISNLGYTTNFSAASSMAIQTDGKIVVASYVDYQFAVLRYNANGSLDKAFGKDGVKVFYNGYGVSTSSVAIQSDGKIVISCIIYEDDGSIPFFIARLTTDGNLDNTFNGDGFSDLTSLYYNDARSVSVAIQKDGKIVAVAYSFLDGLITHFAKRFNTDGSVDERFLYRSPESSYDVGEYEFVDYNNLLAIQDDGKIIVSGKSLTRCNPDGSIDSTFGNNGLLETHVSEGKNIINSIVISGNKLYAAGYVKDTGRVGLIERYLLDGSDTPPTVSITNPLNNQIIAGPANIHIKATASDSDDTITKVEFYNGTALLHTETVIPYGYVWRNVPLGNYTLTAKAYDNSGNVTISAPIHISVVPNKAPAVSIISPTNNQVFADTATIRLIASALDTDGRITKVEFYKDSTLLRTEYKYPYTYNWTNLSAGTYTITAKATDNWGAQTTSKPITVTVVSDSAIVSSRPYQENKKTAPDNALGLRLSPNPASNIVNISTSGLQQNKRATLSIITTSGIVLKTINISNAVTQLNVSSLASGVYTLKIISGEKVLYKQFVKL